MRSLALGSAAFAIVASACGGGSAATGAGTGRTISVNMSEFSYAPATISLKAGETVTLRLNNTGTVEHEFMAGRQAMTGIGYVEDWLAIAQAGHGGGHDMDHRGAGVRLQPKGMAQLTLTAPAEKGEFEYGCFMPGHYEGGMRGKLVVD